MCIQVTGRVAARVPGTENPKLDTGDIEVVPSELRILNRADDLPFPIDSELHNEDLRLTYRYYDLRRPRLVAEPPAAPSSQQKRRAIISTIRATSKSRRRSFPRARRKAREIFLFRAD